MLLIPARRAWAVTLNLIGIALVATELAQRDSPATMVAAAWVAWSLWVISLALPENFVRVRAVTNLIMIAAGSLAAPSTNVVGFVPAVVGLIVLAGTPAVPLMLVGAAVAVSVALAGAGALVDPPPRHALISIGSLLVICVLGGLSRRQYRASEAQSRALLEERARVAALTERSRIARDLHDVLAHSLGGLAIQLEAVDALLESGHPTEARTRVQAARKLAVAGMDEARRAVSSLREPDEPLSAVVTALAETHRAIGAQVTVHGDADQGMLGAAARTAVRRAVQELLTNARRHAPGGPTALNLTWSDAVLTITATTQPGALCSAHPDAPSASCSRHPDGPAPLSGHGLAGMRKRVSEAGGTMTVREGPPFEVVLRLPGSDTPPLRLDAGRPS